MDQSQSLQSGDVLRRIIQIVSGNFPQLAAISAVVYIPLFILVVAGYTLVGGEALQDPSLAEQEDAVLAGCLTVFLVLLGGLLTQVQSGAFAFGVFEALRGRKIDVGRSLRVAVGRLLPMIVAGIFVTFAVMFGLVLLIVPGVIIAMGLSVVIPVVVVEKQGPLEAFQRSWELTKGHRGRIFVLMVIYMLLVFAMMMVLGLLGLNELWVEQILNVGLSFFSATGLTLIYHDLRRIKDGLGTDELVAVFE